MYKLFQGIVFHPEHIQRCCLMPRFNMISRQFVLNPPTPPPLYSIKFPTLVSNLDAKFLPSHPPFSGCIDYLIANNDDIKLHYFCFIPQIDCKQPLFCPKIRGKNARSQTRSLILSGKLRQWKDWIYCSTPPIQSSAVRRKKMAARTV